MEPFRFDDWLTYCTLVGPNGLCDEQRFTVTAALAKVGQRISTQYPGVAIETIAADAWEYYPFTNTTEAWSVYLYLRFHQRYDALPFFNHWFINRYSLKKTLYQLVTCLEMEKSYTRLLKHQGIILASDLLHRGWNRTFREEIAQRIPMPYADILSLTKACDLSRMLGMMGKTLQRCLAMGYDSLQKFRVVTPDDLKAQLQTYLSEYNERTSAMIDYAWYPLEARELPDIVDYTD